MQMASRDRCRALTGAWIETFDAWIGDHDNKRRALTGAWIETELKSALLLVENSRALTGAWIETKRLAGTKQKDVAPSRARGLKLALLCKNQNSVRRALTGAWIETTESPHPLSPSKSRALTGAWIET